MKSLIYTGQPDESLGFEDKPTPKPGNNQVQVRLSASALNHRDQWIRMGMYPGLQSNVTLGSDGCGIVTEIGAGVDHGWKGKEVVINPNNDWGPDPMAQSLNYHILGMPKDGTFGEFLVVDEDRIHPKPGHLTSEQAAALPLGGLTAFRACFTHGQIGPGKKVLVTGIGGGVALYALQFSNAVGAEVFVSSSSDAKIQKATGLGAKAGFNYRNKDWVKEAASVSGFDVIIDSAGGDAMNNYLQNYQARREDCFLWVNYRALKGHRFISNVLVTS